MGFGDMTAGMGVKMLFDGQRRTKPILTCELIPSSTWAKNLRTLMGQDPWDVVRKKAYIKARYKCEICSGRGPKWPVECHEQWDFNMSTKIQTLVKLLALCPSCHAVKHWGFSRTQGRESECRDHIAFVNGWTPQEIDHHVTEVFSEWQIRSRITWTVDLAGLSRFGLDGSTISGIVPVPRTRYGVKRIGAGRYVPDTPGAYAGPEEEPWDSIPEDCL